MGSLFSDFYVGWGSSSTFGLSFALTDSFYQTNLLSPFQRNLPLLFSFIGTFFATIGLRYWKKIIRGGIGRFILAIYRPLSTFFYHSGFFNRIYNSIFDSTFFLSYTAFTKLLDKGVLELFGPVGLYRLVANSSALLRK